MHAARIEKAGAEDAATAGRGRTRRGTRAPRRRPSAETACAGRQGSSCGGRPEDGDALRVVGEDDGVACRHASSGMSRNAARSSMPLPRRASIRVSAPRNSSRVNSAAIVAKPAGRGVARGERAERLGPKREGDGVALGRGELRHHEGAGAEPHDACPAPVARRPCRREDWSCPMKAATNRRRGPAVELLRRADLLEAPAAHHRDPVGDRQRLLLVVRDVDRR